ncbi:hypothetical protein CAPTEDRAFT_210445 [Capitella teleta]|uniref:DUF19 domain-containing protein n=1 Tax=Capitella teleta TaxID=283909 RepID=R7U098_CAPTE|nr:hypothetical protein CAPTEDRAFT_210445 [Capitella teleta]|eukprot:ELT96630.1 hypothetical protein CAPTEDRAFT_210445 [Capitella teleta]
MSHLKFLLNSLISCLDEATSSCSVEEKSNLAVFTDTFKYLCSSSVREVYRRTSDCVLKNNLDYQTLTCLTQFINIPIEGFTSVEKCRILNNALDCVVRTANKTCGADLAEVYLTTFRNILGHNFIKNNPFCEISVTVVAKLDVLA